jgi:hypothetical protein
MYLKRWKRKVLSKENLRSKYEKMHETVCSGKYGKSSGEEIRELYTIQFTFAAGRGKRISEIYRKCPPMPKIFYIVLFSSSSMRLRLHAIVIPKSIISIYVTKRNAAFPPSAAPGNTNKVTLAVCC